VEPPKVDFARADQVLKEFFDDDRWVKDEFQNHLSQDLVELSERLAAAFAAFSALDTAAGEIGTEQAGLVAGFIFGVIDDVLVSTKLLLSGKLMPSGNLMRQAVEGIAVAVLCANPGLTLVYRKRNETVPVRYWERVKESHRLVESHKAVGQLELNRATLGVNAEAIERLKIAKRRYNRFSHPNAFGLATRASLGPEGQVYAGGHFDIEKLDGYRIEMRERIGFCIVLPKLINDLATRLARLKTK
jgi:hypothetical protein